jgi:L-2-hydroxyglutarate oxidase LhgO
MSFEHHWHAKTLCKHFSGPVSAEEFMQSVQLVQSDSRFAQLQFSVNDFSAATLPPLTDEQLLTFAAFGIGATHSKVSIVVITGDEQARQMAERYGRLAPFPLQVFATFEQAAAALPEVMAVCRAASAHKAAGAVD